MKDVLYVILGFILFLAFGWAIAYHEVLFKSVFNPMHEQVRHDTFKQSQAYQDGVVQELMQLRMDYIKASPEMRPAIASVVRHKLAGFPIEKLPYDLQTFYREVTQ